jgi:LysM repeat protein
VSAGGLTALLLLAGACGDDDDGGTAGDTTAAAGTTTTAPSAAVTTTVVTAAPVTTTTTIPSEYTVVAGDTMSGIAKKVGVTVEELAQFNGITDPNLIQVGQVLKIPKPGEVVVTTAPPPTNPDGTPIVTGPSVSTGPDATTTTAPPPTTG